MQASFNYNLQDVWHGTWLRAWKSNFWIQVWMPLLGGLLLLLDFVSWWGGGGWSMPLAALAAFCLFFRPALFHAVTWLQVRRYLKRNPDIFRQLWLLETAESGLKLTNGGVTSPIPWAAIIGYRIGKRNILLYFKPEIALNIPRRVFESKNAEAEFLELLKTHGLKPY